MRQIPFVYFNVCVPANHFQIAISAICCQIILIQCFVFTSLLNKWTKGSTKHKARKRARKRRRFVVHTVVVLLMQQCLFHAVSIYSRYHTCDYLVCVHHLRVSMFAEKEGRWRGHRRTTSRDWRQNGAGDRYRLQGINTQNFCSLSCSVYVQHFRFS